jgi:hypothetical protein
MVIPPLKNMQNGIATFSNNSSTFNWQYQSQILEVREKRPRSTKLKIITVKNNS